MHQVQLVVFSCSVVQIADECEQPFWGCVFDHIQPAVLCWVLCEVVILVVTILHAMQSKCKEIVQQHGSCYLLYAQSCRHIIPSCA